MFMSCGLAQYVFRFFQYLVNYLNNGHYIVNSHDLNTKHLAPYSEHDLNCRHLVFGDKMKKYQQCMYNLFRPVGTWLCFNIMMPSLALPSSSLCTTMASSSLRDSSKPGDFRELPFRYFSSYIKTIQIVHVNFFSDTRHGEFRWLELATKRK